MSAKQNIEFKKIKIIVYVGVLIGLIITLAILSKEILAPLIFAFIIAIVLSPICNYLENKGLSRVGSVVLTYVALGLTTSIVLVLVSFIFADIYADLPSIKSDLANGFSILQEKLSDFLNVKEKKISQFFQTESSNIVNPLFNILELTLSHLGKILSGLFLMLIFSFFFLLYRDGISYLFFYKNSKDSNNFVRDFAYMIRAYVNGVLLVSLLIGTFNSISLWLIGIDYAFFWGYLSGILIIIPYIGTIVGGLLPFLYALTTTETIWQPAAVLIFYLMIQQLEGNFITPKIIGDKINVNPFTIILSMLFGGLIWGIAGVILAIPASGALRIFLLQYASTYKMGLLISNNLYNIEEYLEKKKNTPQA